MFLEHSSDGRICQYKHAIYCTKFFKMRLDTIAMRTFCEQFSKYSYLVQLFSDRCIDVKIVIFTLITTI